MSVNAPEQNSSEVGGRTERGARKCLDKGAEPGSSSEGHSAQVESFLSPLSLTSYSNNLRLATQEGQWGPMGS